MSKQILVAEKCDKDGVEGGPLKKIVPGFRLWGDQGTGNIVVTDDHIYMTGWGAAGEHGLDGKAVGLYLRADNRRKLAAALLAGLDDD